MSFLDGRTLRLRLTSPEGRALAPGMLARCWDWWPRNAAGAPLVEAIVRTDLDPMVWASAFGDPLIELSEPGPLPPETEVLGVEGDSIRRLASAALRMRIESDMARWGAPFPGDRARLAAWKKEQKVEHKVAEVETALLAAAEEHGQ